MPDIRHEPDAQRFAVDVEGGTAELQYRRREHVVAFVHTFVPRASRGDDTATSLVEAGLAWAREEGLRVRPVCPFVKAYMEAHPETQDLLL
ncbi:MAG: GNAT family N-acetyltransferase [Bacteroidota bacterium]